MNYYLLLAIDGAAIITSLIDSSPTMAVAGLFGWYMYRQSEKKDLTLIESEKAKASLTERLIADKEKRIISEQEQINLLKSVVERIDGIPVIVKEAVERLVRNQAELRAEIKELRSFQKQ